MDNWHQGSAIVVTGPEHTRHTRIQGNITYRRTDRVTPLAVPALLDIGRERVFGDNTDVLLAEAEADLIAEATEGEDQGVLI